jgi:hypothetical protein
MSKILLFFAKIYYFFSYSYTVAHKYNFREWLYGLRSHWPKPEAKKKKWAEELKSDNIILQMWY